MGDHAMLANRRDVAREGEIDGLLDAALAGVRLPQRYGVILEGSIAEGFGNRTSDVDFLVVTEDDHKSRRLPTVMFIDGYRVEIRTRSSAEISADAKRINRISPASAAAVAKLTGTDLDLYQRFARGRTLRNPMLIEELRKAHDEEHFKRIVQIWRQRQALESADRSWLMWYLGQNELSAAWMRRALTAAAKAWVAGLGETYLADKWLDAQLRRAGSRPELRDSLWQLMAEHPTGEQIREYLEAASALMAQFGVAGHGRRPEDVCLEAGRGITTWQLGGQVCILREKKELLVLGKATARVWRSVVFSVPISQIVKASKMAAADALGGIELFHRLGLVTAVWPSGQRWKRHGAAALKVPVGPVVSFDGIRNVDLGPKEIAALPISASRLCFAGCELVWANISLENAWEDFVGAFERKHWKIAQAALHGLVSWSCQAAFSAFGVNPPPDHQEVAARLHELGRVDDDLVREARELTVIGVDGETEVLAVRERVERFLSRMGELTGGGFFPSSFETGDDWKRTLELGFEWARLASYIDEDLDPEGRTFPIEEVRDMLALHRASHGPTRSGGSTHGGPKFGRWRPRAGARADEETGDARSLSPDDLGHPTSEPMK